MLGSFSKKNLQYSLIAVFTVINIFIWTAVVSANHRGVLTVAFLDVGQGDAIYIEAPNGNQMLIDGGASSGVLLRSLAKVMPYWDRSIDVVLATHPDQDHVGGLPAVMQTMNIETVVTTENTAATGAYNVFEESLRKESSRHVIARAGERIILDDGVVFEVLFPDRDTTGWETNTSSIIGKLTYGNESFLFTGDAPQSVEQYLIGKNSGMLHANVLKLGHHGSKNSNSKIFLSAVDPEYAIVSAGKDNRYGHPNKEVLDVLSALKIPVVGTLDRGTIMFTTEGTILQMK